MIKNCFPGRNYFPDGQDKVLLTSEHLRGYVVRCAAECARPITGIQPLLTHAVVSQLDMTFTVQKDIVQFQIAIDDS